MHLEFLQEQDGRTELEKNCDEFEHPINAAARLEAYGRFPMWDKSGAKGSCSGGCVSKGVTIEVERQTSIQHGDTAKAHRKKFGSESRLSILCTKLMEEVGEFAGAVIRHLENRDGKTWQSEMNKELGDVLVVLTNIVELYPEKFGGASLPMRQQYWCRRFIEREWSGINPQGQDDRDRANCAQTQGNSCTGPS